MEEAVLQFYDRLADEYHLMFADWRQEVLRQANILDALIRAQLGESARDVLDCTCGIGTQAIALATRGYLVRATDLSPAAVARASAEAASFGVKINASVADLRELDRVVGDQFDVVISGDNSLSHFLNDDDLHLAARQMRARVRPGGLLLATIRDYDAIFAKAESSNGRVVMPQLPGAPNTEGDGLPRATLPRVSDDPNGRRIAFQVWDWADDRRSYRVHQFFVDEGKGDWRTSHHATRFRALLRSELNGILQGAGFSEISWEMPAESGFYQPVVMART